jgi:pyruvate/2-oxoglutarate dehydrogenase complex dihydrolipoamide acyltransferase (E2) component
VTRPRHVEIRPFPSNRRLVTAAMRAGKHTAPMHGLLDLDVTTAIELLAAHDPPLSFTAFVVAAAGRAVAMHPEVHAYRDWRGRLLIHRHVDVSTVVEITTPQGPFPLVHTLHDADIRDVASLTAELHHVKDTPLPHQHRASHRLLPLATRVPGVLPAMYTLLSRSARLRQRSGTVTVTAIGMFADGGGHAIAPLTLMSVQLVVGGITERPRMINGQLEVRKVLDLTVTLDHNVVDGGPATRFGAELRQQIETAQVLSDRSCGS